MIKVILPILESCRNMLHKVWIDVTRFNKNKFERLSKYNIDTVIDIWANIGQFLWEYHKILPNAHFHSFEPLPSAFAKLKKNYGDTKNISVYNVWLGRNKSTITMNECDYDPSSSMLEMSEIHKKAYPHTQGLKKTEVKVETLDSFWIKSNNMLIKIDTQWYEDQIISWGMDTIKKAKICILETSFYPLYIGQPLFSDIYDTMIGLWFVYYWGLEQWLDPKDGKLLFQDSVFIKKD